MDEPRTVCRSAAPPAQPTREFARIRGVQSGDLFRRGHRHRRDRIFRSPHEQLRVIGSPGHG